MALAEIYDGGSRSASARIGGVGLQIVRDWVVCFNARGPDGLIDGNVPGKRSRLDDARFVSKPPNPPEKPSAVWINPPTRTAYIRV